MNFSFSHAFDWVPSLFPKVRQDEQQNLALQLQNQIDKQKQTQQTIIIGGVIFLVFIVIILIVNNKLNS